MLVLMVDGRRGLRQAWLPAVVGGVGFGGAQYLSSNFFSYQVADILGAIVGALAIVALLRVWQPSDGARRRARRQQGGAGSVTASVGTGAAGAGSWAPAARVPVLR